MTIQEVLYAVMLVICGSISLKAAYGVVVSLVMYVGGLIAKESYIYGAGFLGFLLNGIVCLLSLKGALFAFGKLF